MSDEQIQSSLSIAIPASFTDVFQNRLQQTIQIGRVARAAAIFRINEILIYPDLSLIKQNSNIQFITRVLLYLETPQYLRKHLFKKEAGLRHVGVLPPLRTPHHPLERRITHIRDKTIREGYAYQLKKRIIVDIGADQLIPLSKPFPEILPNRVTVQLRKGKSGDFEARLTNPPKNLYWGYQVKICHKLIGDFLQKTQDYDLIIATSRKGQPINSIKDAIKKKWKSTKNPLILFGSYREGLREILKREELSLNSVVHFTINIAPQQGVASIRTEEAIMTSLAILRFLEHD